MRVKTRRYEQVKAHEHLLTRAYINVRDRNKAQRWRRIATYIRVLGDEIELDVADRHRISFLTTHLCKFFDNAAKTQHFLEILHGIGVV